MNNERRKTLRMTQLAMIGAIIVLMAFTPLGYLKIGPLSITFLTIPVVIGAILMTPADGAILGAVFGITSFAQCFGMDAFGTALMSYNPLFTAIVCILPRTLIGLFAGLVNQKLEKTSLNKTMSYAVSALVGALTNTVFFVGLLILLFKNSETLSALGDSVMQIVSVLVTTNSLVEAIVCVILVTIISGACVRVLKNRK